MYGQEYINFISEIIHYKFISFLKEKKIKNISVPHILKLLSYTRVIRKKDKWAFTPCLSKTMELINLLGIEKETISPSNYSKFKDLTVPKKRGRKPKESSDKIIKEKRPVGRPKKIKNDNSDSKVIIIKRPVGRPKKNN